MTKDGIILFPKPAKELAKLTEENIEGTTSSLLKILNGKIRLHERWFLYLLLFLTLFQIGLILLFHKTLIQVPLVVSMSAVFRFGINLFLAHFSRPKVIRG
jgi:hypothetical protein